MKTRVVKKNNVFYPQYLKTWWFGKYKKWINFEYEININNPCPISPHQVDRVPFRFNTIIEAKLFLKKCDGFLFLFPAINSVGTRN